MKKVLLSCQRYYDVIASLRSNPEASNQAWIASRLPMTKMSFHSFQRQGCRCYDLAMTMRQNRIDMILLTLLCFWNNTKNMNYLILYCAVIFLAFVSFSCKNKNQSLPGMNTDLPLLFQSGFEPTTHLIMREFPKFAGKDETLKEKNDWEADISPIASSVSLVTTDGKVSQNFASIIPEPGNPKNHVLHFKMDEVWMYREYRSARVQCDFYGIRTGLKEFYQTVRIFLPDDFKVVGKYPHPINWLTILELWNNVQWVPTIPYAFRITLGMGKTTAEESDLIFIIDAEDYERTGEKRGYIKIWVEKNHEIKVPIGEWFTMHYYFKEGNAETGRFVVILETKKKGRQTVFDITNFTHNTTDPAPDGLTAYNPFKMYTSMDLATFVKEQGKNLNIYWDDFKLYGK